MDRNHQNQSQGPSSALNPNAAPWGGVPQAHKCLYITFSYGNPVTENEIFHYFTSKYGVCVERIYIHPPRNGPRLFGKITFTSSIFPGLVLNGRQTQTVVIGEKTIFCKRFNPQATA